LRFWSGPWIMLGKRDPLAGEKFGALEHGIKQCP